MKKRIIFCLIVCCLFLLLTGCKKSEKQKLEKQASENAINYVQEKYGFNAKVVSTEASTKEAAGTLDVSLGPRYNGIVKVRLEYDNKLFDVYITGKEDSIDGGDNYQQDEIFSKMLGIIDMYVGEHYSYNFDYYDNAHRWLTDYTNVFEISQYYDGNNIQDFIDNVYLTIYYVDKTIISDKIDEIAKIFSKGVARVDLYNFRSEQLLNEYQNMQFKYSYSDERIAYYVTDVILISDGQKQIYSY